MSEARHLHARAHIIADPDGDARASEHTRTDPHPDTKPNAVRLCEAWHLPAADADADADVHITTKADAMRRRTLQSGQPQVEEAVTR